MKNKQKAALRLLAALLALTLLAPLGLTASAADGPDTIYIDSASDFVSFAKSCALDTWSAGKTVILRADISLAGMDYTPVAAFGGTFDGGGHTISDLNLTGSYSPAGLFAVILSGGSVGTHLQMGIGDGVIPGVLNQKIYLKVFISTEERITETCNWQPANLGSCSKASLALGSVAAQVDKAISTSSV